MDATPGAGAANYPHLFRQMIVRSTEAALAAVDPQAAVLKDDERERSLYALSLALDLPEAWPAARDLTLILAPYMEMQGFGADWITYLERAAAQVDEQQDLRSLAQGTCMLAVCMAAWTSMSSPSNTCGKGTKLRQN